MQGEEYLCLYPISEGRAKDSQTDACYTFRQSFCRGCV